MAFLIPSEPMENELGDYLVSIDEIEEHTGFDFLSGLEDTLETALESEAAAEVWVGGAGGESDFRRRRSLRSARNRCGWLKHMAG